MCQKIHKSDVSGMVGGEERMEWKFQKISSNHSISIRNKILSNPVVI